MIKSDYLTGASDPYCIVRCGSEKHKSKVKYRTLNPAWHESFEFPVSALQRVTGRILIECRDKVRRGRARMLTPAHTQA